MAVAVLFGSMGIGVTEHTCALRGKRTATLFADRAACHTCQVRTASVANGLPAVQRSGCCLVTVKYGKIDTGSAFHQALVKGSAASNAPLLAPALPRWVCRFGRVNLGNEPGILATYAPPPPPSGRFLRLLIQTFLI